LEEKSEVANKSKKVKKVYISWEDNDSSTSSESSDSSEEETNLCLMVEIKSLASGATSFLLDVYN